MMKIVAIGLLIVILLVTMIKWKIATLSLLYYMEQKQYKHPNEKEMKDCTSFVVKHMVKDLTGRGGRKL